MSDSPIGHEPQALRPGRRLSDRLLTLAVRLTEIAVVAVLITGVPLPHWEEWLPLKNIVVAMAAVILAGKCLYDTLFYDRFWP